MSNMFEGFDLDGRQRFGIVWCPFAVCSLPRGSGRLCYRAGLTPCRVHSDESGLWCRFWSCSGRPSVKEQEGLF